MYKKSRSEPIHKNNSQFHVNKESCLGNKPVEQICEAGYQSRDDNAHKNQRSIQKITIIRDARQSYR
jgi:hypothetical protein